MFLFNGLLPNVSDSVQVLFVHSKRTRTCRNCVSACCALWWTAYRRHVKSEGRECEAESKRRGLMIEFLGWSGKERGIAGCELRGGRGARCGVSCAD